ncbi:MAG: hypothetical protein KKA73_04180 [Chloroflexi bacterium]|nr:hypothetical protein [Chloroflexota bacterium]MBU1746864.1 hypothetical protein [Chloroflexota bacterium]MBU1878471.1 hypothetical protein [Chloroflexota bacterium]
MSKPAVVSPDQPVAQLTASQLEALIAAIVRRVMREEFDRDYYVNEHGVRVLYAAEEAAPAYLAELQEDYAAIEQGNVQLSTGEEIVHELRDLGLNF